MRSQPFAVLCADPPWSFSDRLPGPKRGAAKHYPTLPLHEIARFPHPPLARDAVLFLWRVATMQEEALFVMRAWGFKPYTEIVWEKLTRKNKLAHFGMGRIVRGSHETCLVGVRGRPQRLVKNIRSRFAAPIGEDHSAKPEEFYRLIVEPLYAGPYCELFARRRRTGWTTYGNELRRAQP